MIPDAIAVAEYLRVKILKTDTKENKSVFHSVRQWQTVIRQTVSVACQ